MFNTKNTKQQGNIGIGQALAYFTGLKWTVSIPLNDSQDYDLIVDDGSTLHRVQVKTTKYVTKSGSYQAMLKTCGGNQSWTGVSKKFDNTSVEILFVLCENGDMYCMPTKDLNVTSTINLSKYPQYKI